MAWHQGLQNPIPEFQTQATLQPAMSLRTSQTRTTTATLVTWGSLKRLSMQAQELLPTNEPITSEHWILALIACLNRNSALVLLCLVALFGPVKASNTPEKENFYTRSPNLWVQHALNMFAHHGTDVTLIYESPLSVASVSFLPTPYQKPEIVLAQLQGLAENKTNMFIGPTDSNVNQTKFRMLTYISSLPGLCFCCGASGAQNHHWAEFNKAKRQWKHRVNQTTCIDKFWVGGGANMALNQSYPVNISVMNTTWELLNSTFPFLVPNTSFPSSGSICNGWIIQDPNLWFFWGNRLATNFHPGNYECASIGYLTLPVTVVQSTTTARQRRSPLGPKCHDQVIIGKQLSGGPEGWSNARGFASGLVGVLTLGSYANIIAQENRASIIGLTCRLENSINATTLIVRDLQDEIFSLHQVQLQHRFALDYLLARQGGFCQIIGPAACQVQFHDLNKTIEDELTRLHELIQHNKVKIQWDPFSWLASLLPDVTWLRQLISGLIAGIIVLIVCCCFVQCIPQLIDLCTKTKETMQRRAMYYAYHQLKNTKGEM